MSVKYGIVSEVSGDINSDIVNNIGTHNDFIVISNTGEVYPDKIDPVVMRFDGTIQEWIYVTDKTTINFGYLTETVLVRDDDMFLTKIPLDRIIWDVFELDTDGNIINVIDPKLLYVDKKNISNLSEYIGKTIRFMYCFGDKEENGVIVPVNLPREDKYLNEDLRRLEYDGPYDMNDILQGSVYPPASTSFDRKILNKVKELEAHIRILEDRIILTTDKIEIIDNFIDLPFPIIGEPVHNMAYIYDSADIDDNVIRVEVTCLNNEGRIMFDENDGVDGKFAIVSYLAQKIVQ